MAFKIEPLLTIADLDAMPDDGNRYEIVEGELFVSCAPDLTHQRALGNLLFLIRKYLELNPIGEALFTPGLMLSNITGVIPDLVFMTNARRDQIAAGERLISAPDIVVEIVSSGSENRSRDRVIKRQLYAKYDVPEYWIVDPERRTVEVFRLKEKSLDLEATFRVGDQLSTPSLPGFGCGVADLFKP